MGTLSRQHPREESILEWDVIDQCESLGQRLPERLDVERSGGSTRERVDELPAVTAFHENRAQRLSRAVA